MCLKNAFAFGIKTVFITFVRKKKRFVGWKEVANAQFMIMKCVADGIMEVRYESVRTALSGLMNKMQF